MMETMIATNERFENLEKAGVCFNEYRSNV